MLVKASPLSSTLRSNPWAFTGPAKSSSYPLKSWQASLLLNPVRIFTLKRLAIRPEQVQRGLQLDEQTECDRERR
jgi:hypothetical protein